MKTNELPPVLESKLAEFRKRVWVVKLAEGLLAALFGLAVSYVVVFALDRFFETNALVRGLVLVCGTLMLGIGLPLKWHRWVWRQRRLEDAARLLRRKFPRLGDQLLGIVELAKMDAGATGRSERLVQAAMEQAANAVKDQDFAHAVPQARHRQWGWAVAGIAALVLGAFVGVSEAARNALLRWLMPWRDTERYTFARMEKLPDKLVVPYAEPFQMPVTVAKETRWTPDEAKARIASQPSVKASLNEKNYPLAFPPQKQDAAMSLKVGDVRKTVQVEPKTRPELTGLSAKLKLPAYLQYKSEPVVEVNGGAISLLKSAQASFTATAGRALSEATMDGKPQKVEAEKIVTGFEAVGADAERRFAWKDKDGLAPREPLVLKINAVEDEAPKIIARRESLEQVVLDSEVVAFDVSASDDFGLKRVGLDWTGAQNAASKEKQLQGEKIAAAGEPEKRSLDARATFCAEREGVPPQTVEVRAWAEDYLPGRKRSHSATFVLHVLNKTDHALWLTQQMGKWLQLARETYEREQLLHETNRELHALSAADLDRPENRRRVSQQAAAENANSDRLAALTQSGRNMLEQATKNPEFDAPRLESWATMLKSLKDIAGQRMPSVADLLKQTAGAQAGSKSQSNPNGSDNKNPSASQQASSQKPGGSQQQSNQNKPTAPQLSNGPQLPSNQGTPPPVDPNAKPKAPAPSISDRVGSFSKPPEAEPQDANQTPKAPGAGKLKLPTTTLGAAPGGKKEPEEEKPPESPAQETMQKSIWEQRDLLAEFAKVTDQLNEILGSLESSTFVKRLKAASQAQMTVASNVNQKTLDAFGLDRKDTPAKPETETGAAATKEKEQSEAVRVIQSDLEAYFQRKPDQHFKSILDQMRKTQVVAALALVGDHAAINFTGQTIHGAEYWADTLDRWAEEMVAAGKCSNCSSCSGDSLPPEVVLKVMQALRDEMKLRDETRELDAARKELEADKYGERSGKLARTQEKIAINVEGAVVDISMLPQGAEKFGKELRLLTAVKHVMDEAGGILEKPDTGPEAIAAETEAIELLLQARRINPKGGGGGGNNPGGGGGAAVASSAALSDLGPGAEAETNVNARPVGQATGRAGKEFPEEFKTGLDAYFNNLENKGGAK